MAIGSVVDGDGGDYFCQVTNAGGSTTSETARITVVYSRRETHRARREFASHGTDTWRQYRDYHPNHDEGSDDEEPCGQSVSSSQTPLSLPSKDATSGKMQINT